MKRLRFILAAILALVMSASCIDLQAQDQVDTYVCISLSGQGFGKKLKIQVDFGDTPEQIKAGEEYSEILNKRRSHAAILNYMVENQFELVETLELSASFQGTGGTEGIVFIMKKKKDRDS